MTDKNLSFNEMWTRKCKRIGMTLIPLIMLAMFLPVIFLRIKYGVFPEWSVALSSWGTIAAAFAAYYIVEPLSYYPILGLSGTYMAFTAGSISDIRMPASAVAQEAIGVPYGSKEGEVASTLGVAGSLFTTLLVVFLTAVFGTKLIEILPIELVDAIKAYTVPCVFAAVYIQFSKFEPKLTWIIGLTTILYFLLAQVYAVFMVASVVLAVAIAWICYKKGLFNQKEEQI